MCRIAEMQMVICKLLRRYSFALPADDEVRTCYAATLMPAMTDGDKGCPVLVSRL